MRQSKTFSKSDQKFCKEQSEGQRIGRRTANKKIRENRETGKVYTEGQRLDRRVEDKETKLCMKKSGQTDEYFCFY